MTNNEEMVQALQEAEEKIRHLGTVLELAAAGAEGLSNGDMLKDLCAHVRESLEDILASMDDAGGALVLGMRGSV